MKSFYKLSPDLPANLRAFRGRGVGKIMHPAAVSGKGEPGRFLQAAYQLPLRDEANGRDQCVAGEKLARIGFDLGK